MTTKYINQALTLSPLAMNYLGLKKQPFESLVLSDNEIFTDATLGQLLDTTKHHLQFSDLLLIIEGDIGSGKSTLHQRIAQSEIPNINLLSVHADATDTLTQIQKKISSHLKDYSEGGDINDSLKNLQTFDQKPVLVIDDAHVLSDTTLQELLRYQNQSAKDQQIQLKILLLANKGMANTLEKISDLQHNQLYVQEMPEYTPKQIQAFIQHKLILADYTGDSIFNTSNIQTIFKKSDRQPLSIMESAIIHIENLTSKNSTTSNFFLKPAFLLTSSLFILIIGGLSNFYFIQTHNLETSKNIDLDIAEQAQTKEITKTEKFIPQPTNIVFESKPITTEKLPENSLGKIESSIETTETHVAEKTPAIEPTQTPYEPEVITQPKAADTTEIKDEIPASETKPVEAILPEPKAIEPEKKTTALTIEEPIDIKEGKPPVIAVNELDPDLLQLNQLGLHDKSWIMEQDTERWSLQVAGARDPATLLYLAKRHKLTDNSAWYKTLLTGKPWYVLIYGVYNDRDEANQAKQFLPGDLKSKKPFSRSFNSIQPSVQ